MLNNKNQAQNYMAYEIISLVKIWIRKREVISLKSHVLSLDIKSLYIFSFVNYFQNNWMWTFIVCSQQS